ncbi:hypothetical protein BBO99_00000118 [Phytophthora kernoviae]|uniref:Alanine--tRNA ligase n=2 Tax=Phytophthora kernoviae TaxID=325452 RepID=A0A3R7I246_9STRA|nr:hypothetical protein G195_004093 [Phytophthora kernoviae 00238/432]KAG2526300.1 hypothetical protein JM18_004451 [Phytophthora kernoviae]RLM96788.1 hypothetical protein BBI17_000220 [Phytophthora kernoviae]RLN85834.1 hypothetical protein BBO99_00000118 [Phytophthora kernoviae]
MLRLRRCPRRPAVACDSAVRAVHSLPSAEIRTRFLKFFESQGHRVVPSASLVPPGGDSSLLFVNAGMVPFKQAFLGLDGGEAGRGYSRATSAQRCVRAGGKHNDLDQVGLTRRHHTLFEMLGNFSFGDYFKEQAITMCWGFLTQELGLPVDRLHVTVLNSDQEARRLWKQIAGLPDKKILELDEHENFWAMGDSGPCGPCSEVFWDLGDHIADPDERYLELWNLVFMQFFRNEGHEELHALPNCSVDTGMGLERVASVLQGVPSNYHTDVFLPLLENVASVLDIHRVPTVGLSFSGALDEELNPRNHIFGSGKEIQTLRIVSDHLRATYALLHDGVFPSNVGRGYVLRRIIRRAIRHAQQLGVQGGTDGILASIAVPGWTETAGFQQMRAIVSNEERAFEEMLRNGRSAMEKAFSKAQLTQAALSGADAFRLYDTYGIPVDITQVLAEEKGLAVDVEGFNVFDGLEPSVEAHVDRKFRAGCAVHHTATHLLQRALKAELGEHVTQAGSQVTNDRLRFDFAHFGALSIDEIANVEACVNAFASAELDVVTVQMPREEAERSGAICNFGDKYGDIVRVVRVGGSDNAEVEKETPVVSSEFCGGTHVKNTREVFPFALISEGSVAAGTRRVEAVTGLAGARYLQSKAQTLSDVAAQLSTTSAKVAERVTKMQKQMKQLESRTQTLGDALAMLPSTPLASGRVDGAISAPRVELHALDLPGGGEFSKVLKRRAEFLAEQAAPDSVLLVVLGSQVACVAHKETGVHAGKLLQQVVKPLGGRGGGNASFAQGSVSAGLSPQEISRRVLGDE